MYIRRIIFAILTLAWMGAIFSFSAKPAEVSTEESLSVGMKVGAVLNPGFDDWTEEEQIDYAKKIDHPVRKTAHATEYALLGMLLVGTLSPGGNGDCEKRKKAAEGKRKNRKEKGKASARIWLTAAVSWLASALYATSDEIHQLFVAGRSGRFTDVCIDSGGALIGVAAVSLVLLLIARKKSAGNAGAKDR